MQIFLICILIKQQKHVAINNFIHTFYETNFKPKLVVLISRSANEYNGREALL